MANGKTILIIEDEAPAIFSISKALELSGYHVLQAFSAQEGAKLALENHPDLIITDLVMPASSGMDVLKDLRQDIWGKNAKVIVLTNLSGDEHKANANKYQVDKYLVKTDTSLKDLTECVSQLLSGNDANQP